MDTKQIVELLSSALGGGGVTTSISVINQALILLNRYLKDDPAKQNMAIREYLNSLLDIAKEVRQSETGADVSGLVDRFVELMDSK